MIPPPSRGCPTARWPFSTATRAPSPPASAAEPAPPDFGPAAAADYLDAKAPYLDYPTALNQGWPIATGVIEGACRHLVKDRINITGARWGVPGAEAVLKLRALRTNDDFDDYWRYHLTQEHRRVHQAHYINGEMPTAA